MGLRVFELISLGEQRGRRMRLSVFARAIWLVLEQSWAFWKIDI